MIPSGATPSSRTIPPTTMDDAPRAPRGATLPTRLVVVATAVLGAALVVLAVTWTAVLPGIGDAAPVIDTTEAATETVAVSASAAATAAETLAAASATTTATTEAPSLIGGGPTAAATGTVLIDVSDIAAEVVDSVVTVSVTIDRRGPFDLTGSGSGVIVDPDGLIVTNAHVVEDATTVAVALADGTVLDASVLEIDTTGDLALISVDATGLSPIALGSTADLRVGNPVIAVGNPLGLDGGASVTTGIVSALGRVIDEATASLDGVIQTDAAITEGSSGGALLDRDGRLIGVTTAVGVSSVGVEGIGFAIPVEHVAAMIAPYVATG